MPNRTFEIKPKFTWKEYLESGDWVCPKAERTQENPRGAHHWLAPAGSQVYTCIFCKESRTFGREET